jgi:hypothetical protein
VESSDSGSLPQERSSLFDGFYRADPGTSAAVNAFCCIDRAVAALLGNGAYRAFAVTGTAVHAFIVYFISHSLPLILNLFLM